MPLPSAPVILIGDHIKDVSDARIAEGQQKTLQGRGFFLKYVSIKSGIGHTSAFSSLTEG